MAQSRAAKVRIETVPDDRDGQRLDNLLSLWLKGAPKALIYRLIRKGQVRVNGSRCKPSVKVRAGDQVRVPPVRLGQPGEAVPVPSRVIEELQSRILHESTDYLVVDKPAGIAVHSGSGLPWGLIDALREARGEGGLELIHRLDRETSGCLLISRNRPALLHAQRQFREDQIGKVYLCLMQFRLPEDRIRVDAPLLRSSRAGQDRLVRVDPGGRHALSTFRRLQSSDDWTFAEVTIETGRTHQIRVHAAHLGQPLAGDTRYGDRRWNGALKRVGLKRLFLHCSSMTMDLPNGEQLHMHCPLAAELSAVLDGLMAPDQPKKR